MPNRNTLKYIKIRLQSGGVGIYFIVYCASVLVALIKILYIAAALVPEQMGIFISLTLISALMIYSSNLGVMDAYLSRTRSIQRGGALSALLRGQLYSVVTIMSGITTGIVMICAYAYLPSQEGTLNLSLAAAYIFLQPVQAASLIDLQADRKLIKYASYTLIKSAIPLIVIATTISLNPSYVDINLILLCEVVITGALIGLTIGSYRGKLLLKVRPLLVIKLAKQGIYFTGQGLLNNFSSNLDKWFVAMIYGMASAGAYSISNQMILAGSAFGGMITTYLTPTIIISNTNRSKIINIMTKWSATLVTAGSLLAIAILYILWGHITKYYIRYTLDFEIFACTAMTMAFIGSNFYEVYFRAAKNGEHYFYIQVVSNVLLIIFLSFVYFASLNIFWVAASVLFVKIFTWVTCFLVAKYHSNSK